jgi:hypothetical protein
MDHEKAYILGLLVGNGTIANGTFFIKLPLKKWGTDPSKMSLIANDILVKFSQKFFKSYKINLKYDIGTNNWTIIPIGNPDISALIQDLQNLGLPHEGFLLAKTSLKSVKEKLEEPLVEHFLTGIFDTRASLAESHRRFTSDSPIVSVEIPGSTKNFEFVSGLCSWLADLGTIPDQILYNHPNQHSAADPNYIGWKKGFKIRFLVRSFIAKNSFALSAKAINITDLDKIQDKTEQNICSLRTLPTPSPVSIHSEINSPDLPTSVRNKLFFNYHHYCAILGCKHAPVNQIKSIVLNHKDYIFALPRMQKGTIKEMRAVFLNLTKKHFPGKKEVLSKMLVCDAISNSLMKEYLELEQALAYLFSKELNGKRYVGNKSIILKTDSMGVFKCSKIENSHLPPILMMNENNDRAVLISAIKSELNQQLIKKHVSISKDGLSVNII